ncbi:MAG: AAA family ATPase [Patescibacteria group bacterium]
MIPTLEPNTPVSTTAAPSSAQSNVPATLESELLELRQKLVSAEVPDELKLQVEKDLNRLERTGQSTGYDEKYERLSKYLDWVVNLPWNKKSNDILDLEKTKEIFEKHHYGMQEVKDRFLEYVSVLKMRSQTQKNPYVKAPILLLVGLVGTGKTTFAYSLAEALGRQLIRIPFGGMGSARDLRGQSRLHLEAEPGYVIKGLRQAGTRNPVILLDEIDRVADDARNDIMGVLVELLDPGQNFAFTDHYIDYPFDLSEVIFLATANNTRNIATAVFDRLEQISMPSYTDEQKIVIAQKYILPQLLEEAGLTAQQFVLQDPNLWTRMVRPLGYDAGIRTLQRTLQGAVRKAAREIVEKHVPQVVITEQNINQFLPQY